MGLPVILRAPLTIGVALSIAGGVFATLAGQHAINIIGQLFIKSADRRMDLGGYWFRRVMAFAGVTLNPFWKVVVLNKFPREDLKELDKDTNGGKIILMMNHLSNCDPWICSYAMNPYLSLKWITKDGNAKIPIAGGCVRNSGDLLVHFVQKGRFDVHKGTTGPMMLKARAYLDRGMGLAVYPEAIRNLNPKGPLSEFKLGFFMMAIEAGATIIPMALSGSENAWPRGTWMFNTATIYVSWGELIKPHAGETAEQLRDRVSATISAMRDSHPDRKAYLEQVRKEVDEKATEITESLSAHNSALAAA